MCRTRMEAWGERLEAKGADISCPLARTSCPSEVAHYSSVAQVSVQLNAPGKRTERYHWKGMEG